MNLLKTTIFYFTSLALLLIVCCNSDPDEPTPNPVDPTDGVKTGITLEDGTATDIAFGPIVLTDSTSGSLSIQITSISSDDSIVAVSYGYIWSDTDSSPDIDENLEKIAISETQPISIAIENLEPLTEYFVRGYVETDQSYGLSAVFSFSTAESIANIIVINEGNFSAANGSFDLFNDETEEYTTDPFDIANGFPIGATIQNAVIQGDFILATTNAPDKVEIIDKNTFKSVAFVNEGVQTPFGIAANENFAFVSNWGTFNNESFVYDNPSIVTVDLATYEIVSTLSVSVQPQNVVILNNDKLYVSNVGNFISAGTTISTYAIATDGSLSLDQTINVPSGPDKMVVDANDNIWLLCNSGALVEINTTDNTVSQTIENIEVSGFNEKMVVNPSRSNVYWVGSSGFPDYNSAIYSVSVDSPVLLEPLITGTNFHGIGIDDNTLYIGDHAAYQAVGSVLRYANYDDNPLALDILSGGLAPNGFLFR